MPEEILTLSQDPDWSQPLEERHEYLTDVLAAYSSLEQRIQLRTFPRLRLAYRLALLDAQNVGRVQSDLWRLGARRVHVPLWQDAAVLEAPANPSDTFLELTAETRRFRAGKLAMIWRDPQTFELVTVEAVNPPSGHVLTHGISLEGSIGVVGTWPADGRTYVMPILIARLEDAPEIFKPNSQVATMDLHTLSEGHPPPDDSINSGAGRATMHLASGTAVISQNLTNAFDDDRGVLWSDFLLQRLPPGANVVKIYAVADAQFIAPEEFPCAARVAFGDETLPVGVLDTNGDEIVADTEPFDGQFYADTDGSDYEFIGSGLTLEQWLTNARIQAATGHSLFLPGLNDVLNVRGVGFGIYFNFDFAPHDLTSDTSHAPIVISSSSEHASFPSWKAFDGSSATYWLGTNGGSDWLAIDLGSGNSEKLHSYAITVNSIPEPTRAPKDWFLEGSTDGSTWKRLHAVTGQTGWASGETRTFTCDPPKVAYRHFRIRITANNGDATYTQIQELKLYRDHPAADVFDGSDALAAPVAIPAEHGVTWAFPNTATIAEPGDGHGLATGQAAAWFAESSSWPDSYRYRDTDVWPYEPDRAADVKTIWRRSLHHRDSPPGINAAWDRAAVPLLSRDARRFPFTDREALDEFIWLLERRFGRLVPFWFPTWNRDLQMSANLPQGEIELQIQDIGYSAGPFQNAARRHLAFIISEAEHYYREVIDATPGDPGEEILTLESPLPVTLDKDRTLICYLIYGRLATDEPGLTWQTVQVAEGVLDTEEIPIEAEVAGS